MNKIYIEAKTLSENEQAMDWLDKCGAKFRDFGVVLFSEFALEYGFDDRFVTFNELGDKTFLEAPSYRVINGYTHTPTALEFCQGVARILGIPEPTFGEVTGHVLTQNEIDKIIEFDKPEPKGMAIEVSRLSKEDIVWLAEAQYSFQFSINGAIKNKSCVGCWSYGTSGFSDKDYYESQGFTITDSPTKFMEYVAQKTGKEYKMEPTLEKLNQSWETALKEVPQHKVYRILDSLDDIPLDTRIPLSEWIPPFQKDVLFIIKGKAFVAHIWKLQESIFALGGSNELIKDLDGEWMRIV